MQLTWILKVLSAEIISEGVVKKGSGVRGEEEGSV